MKERLTWRAYAQRRGCSHTAVQKAVKSGKLNRSLIKVGKRVLIDPAIADREWRDNTDPMLQREPESRAGGVAPGTKPPNAGEPKQGGLYGPEAEGAINGAEEEKPQPPGPSLQRLRAYDMGFRAQLSKLELEERTAQLVRASAVSAEGFRTGRELRDHLLRLPARLTQTLMVERDARVCEQTIRTEILRALEAIVKDPLPRVPPATSTDA